MEILISIFIFMILVLIGVWPLISFGPKKGYRETFEIEDLKEWLKGKVKNIERSLEMMSEELPPEVYNDITNILTEKPRATIRVLTKRSALSEDSDGNGQNKLVMTANSDKTPNIELRVTEKLPRNHLKIFDRQSAWVEEYHPPGQNYREGYILKDPSKVSIYVQDFEWHWKRASRLPVQ